MSHKIRYHKPLSTLGVLPLALAAMLTVQDAQASGFQLQENDAAGMGRAYSGQAATPGDCAVVVNNPAAMTEFNTQCFQVDVTAIDFSTRFHGSGVDAVGSPLTGGNGGNGGATLPVPAIHYILPLSGQFAFGAALSMPYGFQTEYDNQWAGRYQAQKTKLQSPAITFSGAWKAADSLSIGASIVAQRTSASLTQAINLGTILMVPTGGQLLPQGADGLGRLDGKEWAYGWGLGVLWKPTAADRIGFNFRSQINYHINGNATFLVQSNVLPLFGGAFVNTTGKANLSTPYTASAGWWHTLDDRWSFGANVSFTHWSSFQSLVVTYANPAQARFNSPMIFDFRDTWFGSIGGEYRLDNQWTLRAGIAYDQTPTVNAYRNPRIPDGDRRWLALGAGYKVSDSLRLDVGFAHLWVSNGTVNDMSATFDTLTGYFKSRADLLAVSAQFMF
ncbi:MAG: outer membrane protein transport protein [Rhodanobacter sp.]|jgi:long-chain fatty acid transport protein|nr:outer membrane protein transport protein [Rhodanobacter sp.]